MDLDPIGLAVDASTPAEFEQHVLEFLRTNVGFDAAFIALRGATPTCSALDCAHVSRALRPGSVYEAELLPVKRAALGARGVAVDTEVLGPARVRETAYHRHFAAPLGGRHTLM